MADIAQVIATGGTALVSAAAGAGLTYWLGALNRRHRVAREDKTRWYEERLKAYVEFTRAAMEARKLRNPDDYNEVWQAIRDDLWKRHEKGYKHDGGASLLTYAWPYLRPLIHKTLDEYRHYEKVGNKPLTIVVPSHDDEGFSFDDLQELALEQGRDRLYLEPLYESPIPGLRRPLEQGIPSEDEKLATWLMERLTAEEREVLAASVGPEGWSIHRAAESIPMPYSTYYRKLRDAKAKAKVLARGFSP
jgi:hypothetical protein